ncbi:MAG: hypothetical protein AAB967_02625 [Patescibacteria group bacterium]
MNHRPYFLLCFAGIVSFAFLLTFIPHAYADTAVLQPSGAGDSTQWANSITSGPSSTLNYQMVDEGTAANNYTPDEGDYVFQNDDAKIDNYALPSVSGMTANDTISSVQVLVRARAESTAAGGASVNANIAIGIKTHSTNYGVAKNIGSFVTSLTDPANYTNTWTTNPNTGQAWTKSEIDDLQTYFKIDSCTVNSLPDQELMRPFREYYSFVKTASAAGVNCNVRVSQAYVTVTYTPGVASAETPTGGITMNPGKVKFEGNAFPGGKAVVYKNGVPVTQLMITEEHGRFAFEFTAPGYEPQKLDYRFLFIDREGRPAPLQTFLGEINVNEYRVQRIFAPPTLSLQKALLTKGESLLLTGVALPDSRIEAVIDGIAVGSVRTGEGGRYAIAINTNSRNLSIGTHTVSVRADGVGGQKSGSSFAKKIVVSPFGALRGDFNSDGAINIRDWSVFVAKKDDGSFRTLFDLNGDSRVDVLDLSMFLGIFRK